MLSLAHTLVSIPFGIYLEHPILIFTAAFGFHLFCDTLLHWNFYDTPKGFPLAQAAVDVTSGLLFAWLLLGNQLLAIPIVIAVAGGNMPDIIQSLWEISSAKGKRHLRFAQPFFTLHDKLQNETDNIPAGLISQVILISIAVLLTTST